MRKAAIVLLLLVLVTSLAAAQESPPTLPMLLHGSVINGDTNEFTPEGTLVVAKTSGTDVVVGQAVVENGYYGEPANERMIVNECEAFDLYVVVDGTEIKVAEEIPWISGEVEQYDLRYSLATETGTTTTPTPTSAAGATGGGAGTGASTGGGGVVSPTAKPTATPRPTATAEVSLWQQPTMTILIAAIAIATIGAIVYLVRR